MLSNFWDIIGLSNILGRSDASMERRRNPRNTFQQLIISKGCAVHEPERTPIIGQRYIRPIISAITRVIPASDWNDSEYAGYSISFDILASGMNYKLVIKLYKRGIKIPLATQGREWSGDKLKNLQAEDIFSYTEVFTKLANDLKCE